MTFSQDLALIYPEAFLAVAAMALLMLGAFSPAAAALNRVSIASVASLGVTAALVIGGGAGAAFGGLFLADDFASFAKLLILLATALGVVMSLPYLRANKLERFEFPVLIVIASLGMMMMVSANDLMSLYLGLELQSLSLYVLAAFNRDSVKSTEAGLKYFVLGALASGMLLYGASLVYGYTGSTDFTVIAAKFAGGNEPGVGMIIGIVFILCGLAFKVSAVPFHMWTPDVYEGAPTPVTALFAVAPKIAAIALFLRVMTGPFGDLIDQWQQIVIFVSILSMALGSIAAIAQDNIKRLMAYSSIGHIGYALIGLAVGNADGVRGTLFYMAIYLFMNIGAFACILSMRREGRQVTAISELGGLSKTNPMMAAVLALFMFSMAGIPPAAGFLGKLFVFWAAVDAGLYTLAVLGVVASVIGAFYYLRIIKIMYFDDAVEPFERTAPVMKFVLIGTGLFTLLFFVFPQPLLDGAQVAASALFQG
ncbi:MAG: NADH-quinone oxidoreductase subunit NuoN [Rhodospirillales bacterium]